jgi:hypothetical protein
MKKLNQFIEREKRNLEDFVLWYQERNRKDPDAYPLELEQEDLAHWQRLYRNVKAGTARAREQHEGIRRQNSWPENLSQFLSAQPVKRTCPGITVEEIE